MRHLLNQAIEPSKLNSVILFMRKCFAIFTNEGQQEIEKSLPHTHALKVTGEKQRIVSGKLRKKKKVQPAQNLFMSVTAKLVWQE